MRGISLFAAACCVVLAGCGPGESAGADEKTLPAFTVTAAAPQIDEASMPAEARALVERTRRTIDAIPVTPDSLSSAFADEMLNRVERDQIARRALGSVDDLPEDQRRRAEEVLGAMMMRIDAENTAWLKSRLPENGWFLISRDGPTVANGAFLLVQHSGDQALMQETLTRMTPLFGTPELRGQDYALLFDRVALVTGRPQRYGSQIGCEAGRIGFQNLDRSGDVEARRREVGFTETLEAYAKNFPNFGEPCAGL